MLFNFITKLFRRTEPEPVAPKRKSGRPRLYSSATERLRAWRDRQQVEKLATQAAEPVPSIAAPPVIESIEPVERVEPVPAIDLSALREPGIYAVPPASASMSDVVQQDEPTQHADEQPTVSPIAAPVLTVEEPPDWDGEEKRTDLPTRSPSRIAFLIPLEAAESHRRGLVDVILGGEPIPQLTAHRITNDHARAARTGRHVVAYPSAFPSPAATTRRAINPQAEIIHHNSGKDGKAVWVRR